MTSEPSDSPGGTMKAVALRTFGGPEGLESMTLPAPEPGEGEVLIRVAWAGVGAWDPFEREGGYAEMMGLEPDFPCILGSEGAGTVVQVGAGVTGVGEGDAVYAVGFLNPKGGFYAEYAVVSEEFVSRLPGELSLKEAAGVGGGGLTALRGLDDVLQIRSGESVVIFGASGALGHLAVQLAKRMGAKVFAVASGRDGVDLVDRLGADGSADGREGGWAEAARAFAPGGFDAALFAAGGEDAARARLLVREGGRAAAPNGVDPLPPEDHPAGVVRYNGEPDGDILRRLNRLIDAGPFEVHVSRSFALDQAAQAHAALGEHHLGKLVFRLE